MPLDLLDARADRGAEDDEVQRRRQHRRDDALHQRAPGPRHLERVDRANRRKVHGSSLTRPTKMSSSDFWLVSQVPVPDAGVVEILEQRRDAGPLPVGLVRVDQFGAAVGELEAGGDERPGGMPASACARCSVSCLRPSLRISSRLLLHQDDLALADHADAVGHLLGLVDVVRGEDDRHAGIAQRAHELPHVAPKVRRRHRRSARRGTGSAARATAPWRSAGAASCRPTA